MGRAIGPSRQAIKRAIEAEERGAMEAEARELITCWVCGKEEQAAPSWSFLRMHHVYDDSDNFHLLITLCTDCQLETIGFLGERKDSWQGDLNE